MFKKILTSIILSSFLLTSFSVPFVKAQTWYFPDYDAWTLRVHDTQNPDEIFGERYTQAQVVWVLYSFIYFILAALGNENLTLCVTQYANDLPQLGARCGPILQKIIDSQKTGDAGSVFRPNFTIRYLASIGKKLNIVDEAKAQGFGFTEALNPVQRLWVIVRNLTYFLLVIAMVVLAFMVMFRVKISPQTVITVQSAIPKVIITLILITFSYAIAGFLIDLMYVVIGIIASILTQSGLLTGVDANYANTFANLTTRSAMSLMMAYWVAFIVIAMFAIFSGGFGILAIFGLAAAAGPAMFFLIIIVLVVLIMLFILALRVWFTILKTFVNILLLTIIAPIQILLGVFGFGGFGSWVRNYVANLAVFPTAGVMFFVAFLFLSAAIPDLIATNLPQLARLMPFNPDPNALGTSTWVPPLAWGTTDMDILWLAVSVVVITLIPRVADIIKGLITGRPFAYGTGIGEALGPAMWAWNLGPTREVREQASAVSAWNAANRLIPQSWRKYSGTGKEGAAENLWARLIDRLEKRGGYGS